MCTLIITELNVFIQSYMYVQLKITLDTDLTLLHTTMTVVDT